MRKKHVGAGAGHVRAAAATAIAFLACHPIGAKGDECMWGPYREALLEAGALRVLLEAALAPTQDEVCRKVIEKAAAVGVMYLCTVVGLPLCPYQVLLVCVPCCRQNMSCVRTIRRHHCTYYHNTVTAVSMRSSCLCHITMVQLL